MQAQHEIVPLDGRAAIVTLPGETRAQDQVHGPAFDAFGQVHIATTRQGIAHEQ